MLLVADILRKVDAVLSSMGCEEYTLDEVPYKLGGMDTMELVVEATHEDEEVRRAAMLGLVGAAISTGGLLSMLPCTQPLSSTSSTTTQARPLLFFPKTPSPTMAFTLKMSSNAYCSDPAANAVLTNRAVGPAATSLLKSLGYLRMKMAQDAQLLSHPLYLLACSVHAAADVPNRNMTRVEFTDHDTYTAIQSAGELTVSGSKVRFTLTQPQFSRVSGLNTKHALILGTASGIGMAGLASTIKGLAEAYLAIFGVDLSLNATFQAGTNATPPLKGTAVTASNVANYTATPNHVSLASSSSSAIISAVGLGSRAKTNLYPGGGPQRAATVYTVAAMSSKGNPIQDCSKKAITIMGHDESYTGSAAAVGTDSMQPLSRKAEMHKAACFAMAEAYHLTHADQRRAKDFLDSSQHLLVEDKDQGHEANRRMMAITSSLDKLVAQCLPLVKAMLEAAATTTDSARAAATRKVLDIYTVMVDIIGNPTPGLRRDPPQRPVTMATTSRPPMGAPWNSTFLPGRAQSAAASLPPRAAGTGGRRTSDERQDIDNFYENRLPQLTDTLERGAWLMARGIDGYSDEVIEMYLRTHYGLAVQSIAQLNQPSDWSANNLGNLAAQYGNLLTICTGNVKNTRYIRREIWIADPLEATTTSALAAHFQDHTDPIDLTNIEVGEILAPPPVNTRDADKNPTLDTKRNTTIEDTPLQEEPAQSRQRRDIPTVTLRPPVPSGKPRTNRPTTRVDTNTDPSAKRVRATKAHRNDTHTQTLMSQYLCKPTTEAHTTRLNPNIAATQQTTPDNDPCTSQHNNPPTEPPQATLNRQHITLTTFNVRGLCRSRNEVLNLVHKHNPDILILTETMTQPKSNKPSSGWLKRVMPNYTVHRHEGHSEVLIGIRHDLAIQMQTTMLPPCTDADVNTRCVILSLRQRQSEELTLVATYWPSGNNDDAIPLRRKMQDHIRAATGQLPGSLILAGDINATMRVEDRSEHTEYPQDHMMREFATELRLSEADPGDRAWTYQQPHCNSRIDAILTRDARHGPGHRTHVDTNAYLSDHTPLTATLTTTRLGIDLAATHQPLKHSHTILTTPITNKDREAYRLGVQQPSSGAPTQAN
ncbi:hypothetical protein QJQ45_028980 [Haematococcus lacustris]|nr:hypothetical protein QJQ45_028980 [Haematococcus lacustris]